MRKATPEETLYAHRQSSQLICETGCAGYYDTQWHDLYCSIGEVPESTLQQTAAELRGMPRGVYRADCDKWALICSVDAADRVTIYAYMQTWLDQHIEHARRGIRIIDPHYNNKFILRDGDMIRMTYPDGSTACHVVRYIDGTHCEVAGNLFHICEFAEICENNGIVVERMNNEMPEN